MPDSARATEIAEQIAADFYNNNFCWSARKKYQHMADKNLWEEMPEVVAVKQLGTQCPSEVRLFLTFTAAMDYNRDSTNLWKRSVELFKDHKEFFDPKWVSEKGEGDLERVLIGHGISQRHDRDIKAWEAIAKTLNTEKDCPVRHVIETGEGDAQTLLKYLSDKGNQLKFPHLRGPKISHMWIRMMVDPGEATLRNLAKVNVAVDKHVRRVTKNLKIARTQDNGKFDEEIREAWGKAVEAAQKTKGKIEGTEPLRGTNAALDPALWFFGKYGCTYCESTAKGQWTRFGDACDYCRLRKDDSSKT